MNTKSKICIPLCIIFITLTCAILAGSMSGDKFRNYKKAEVFARMVTVDKVLTKAKPRILSIIDSNMSDSSQIDKESILNSLQNHMVQYDKGKDQKFNVLLEHKIQDLQEIIDIEQNEFFKEMSLDARIPAMKILSDICKQYGIGISYNLNGDIVKLSSLSGENFYENEIVKNKKDIRLEVLIGTLVAIILFITICIYITKKKQLFIKDGTYDGYNKEGFA
ncbi:MAG: hypothetical protein K0S61_1340 [Anaerocolumna sp.]|jgi:hypothetical protein|nr:hypothetical protein [Anaerocolumna sp.]